MNQYNNPLYIQSPVIFRLTLSILSSVHVCNAPTALGSGVHEAELFLLLESCGMKE